MMDFELARQNMVENQVRPWEVLDHRVLDVLVSIQRQDFVPAAYRNLAYADLALPLQHEQSMMKPVIEGRTLQALNLAANENVLEIGTGSGYFTACLARLSQRVTSVDVFADFIDSARVRLRDHGIDNAELVVDDAVASFTPDTAFDAVVVTGAVYDIPARFRDWLKPGGRLFVIRGESPVMHALLLRHLGEGRFTQESLFDTDLAYLKNAGPPRRFAL